MTAGPGPRGAPADAPVLFVVDADEKALALTTSALLRRFGADYRVLTAGNSQDGLEALQQLAGQGAPLRRNLVIVVRVRGSFHSQGPPMAGGVR